MNRYKKIFQERKKEIIESSIISFVITIGFSTWYFFALIPFRWHSISPIPQPGLLDREVLSFIAFLTVGAFLYYIVRLWQVLKFICKDILNSWPLYNFVKKIVWIILLLFTQFYLVPTVVNWSNAVISFFYNVCRIILYAYPSVGVLLIVFIITLLFLKNRQDNKDKRINLIEPNPYQEVGL